MSSPQVTDVDADSASFPQFIRLPLELRLIIWEMAMDEPRSIRILKDPYPKPRTLSVGEDNYYDAPKFFFVNQECRTVAAKVYTNSSLEINAWGFGAIGVNMKVKRGDRLVISCHSCNHEQYLHYVEREQEEEEEKEEKEEEEEEEEEDELHAFCCGNTRVELHDWLLSLLSDGCISNPKSGFQLCRHYVYREMRDISISIDDPFLTLRNPNPQPELSYEDRCRIEDKCRIC
ncbi:hypothetical protein F4680DRAFT_438729 [Xylaria scruposa]|nr:hypothetical protein F4680DRAFT_438729 [Xylaria scruposa]